MDFFDSDLHLHGLYSGGVSKHMTIPVLARESRKKGIELIATGDCLHKEWLSHLKETLEPSNGGYIYNNIPEVCFVINSEVETNDRVHHLIYFESLENAEEFMEIMKPYGKMEGKGFGRPRFSLSSRDFVDKCLENSVLVGPAHIFTPYYGYFAHYDSLYTAYKNPLFIELGLSADTEMANKVSSLKNTVFLSNSDAHSPWPHRIGREFNRFRLKNGSFKELEKAFHRKRELVFNAGLNPKEGKYHLTGCNRCYEIYSVEEAKARGWRCGCGGSIKKGVFDRAKELADFEGIERPPYIHMLPLAEIISLAYHVEVMSKKTQEIWHRFITVFENEIGVLVDVNVDELREVDKNVAEYIKSFRENLVVYEPGRGGKYGVPYIVKTREEKKLKELEIRESLKRKQKSLLDF